MDRKVPVDEDTTKVSKKRNGNNVDDEKLSAFGAYVRLWTYASPLDTLLRIIGCLAGLGAGTAYPLMTIVFGNLINDFNGFALGIVPASKFRSDLNHNSLWFIYLFLGKFGLLYIANFLLCFTATRITRRIRLQYLNNMLHQSVSYFDRHPPGSIATSLSTDTNMIEVGLADKVASVCQGCGMIIGAFGIGFAKSWRLTLVISTTLIWMIGVTMVLGTADSKLQSKQRAIYSQASTISEEALSSILSITALGAKDRIIERFKRPLAKASRIELRIGPVQASIYGNMFFTMQCGYALALFYGIRLLSHGEIKNGGTVINVLFCILLGTSAMGIIAPSIPNFIKAGSAAQQVLKLLNHNTSAENDEGSKLKPESLGWELKFQNVVFSYPKRETVTILDDFCLEIPPGKVTAVVGPSGSGKSTTIGLLERWYTPNSGSVTLDGIDINELDLNWLRDHIGLVQQDPTLFNDTIRQNVLNGFHGGQTDNLSDKEKQQLVIDACVQANAHDFFLGLPDGYDTNVGERAGFLSGGQKQRIAIARSIISNPKILLLDEATSSLDSESEKLVQAALEKASQGRTTLMISHKLATVEKADKIVVIDQGKIVEEGTHAELLAKDGIYCRLLQAQDLGIPADTEKISATVHDTERASHEKLLSRPSQHIPAELATSPVLNSKAISRRHGILPLVYHILSDTKSVLPPFMGGTLGAFIAGLCMPAQAYLFAKLVTVFTLQGEARIHRGNFWSLMFFVLALTNLGSYAILWFLYAIAGAGVSRKYRAKYLWNLLNQDISFFETKGNESGALAALLSSDGEDLEMFFAMSIGLVLTFSVDILSCSILAIALKWKLGLVGVLGCLPVLFLAGYFRLRMDKGAQDRCAANFLESARFGMEAVEAIKTVSSLTLEEKVIERYADRLRKAVFNSSRRMMVSMIFFALSDCVDFLAIALVFWYGGRLVSFGELSVQTFFIIYIAIIFGGQGAGFIFGYSSGITKAQSAANRMQYMERKRAPINSSTGLDPLKLSEKEALIEFRDVRFRYPSRPDVEVLRGIDMKIHPGENICIVGPSGCGKSTIISLLERFYDISSGEILINRTILSNLDIHAFRSTLGLVSQETSLFQGTIRENLCLSVDGDIDDETLMSACKNANIHDFIASLPDGYATECGSRGLALSGGQRQRIAIARTLLRNPRILLLDEATSALDPESQRLVIDALEKASTGRTMISLSHQVEVMKQADRIFVVEHGVIVESGSYESLLSQRGRFSEMLGELVDDG